MRRFRARSPTARGTPRMTTQSTSMGWLGTNADQYSPLSLSCVQPVTSLRDVSMETADARRNVSSPLGPRLPAADPVRRDRGRPSRHADAETVHAGDHGLLHRGGCGGPGEHDAVPVVRHPGAAHDDPVSLDDAQSRLAVLPELATLDLDLAVGAERGPAGRLTGRQRLTAEEDSVGAVAGGGHPDQGHRFRPPVRGEAMTAVALGR